MVYSASVSWITSASPASYPALPEVIFESAPNDLNLALSIGSVILNFASYSSGTLEIYILCLILFICAFSLLIFF
jgi:hypothetical protein